MKIYEKDKLDDHFINDDESLYDNDNLTGNKYHDVDDGSEYVMMMMVMMMMAIMIMMMINTI